MNFGGRIQTFGPQQVLSSHWKLHSQKNDRYYENAHDILIRKKINDKTVKFDILFKSTYIYTCSKNIPEVYIWTDNSKIS